MKGTNVACDCCNSYRPAFSFNFVFVYSTWVFLSLSLVSLTLTHVYFLLLLFESLFSVLAIISFTLFVLIYT